MFRTVLFLLLPLLVLAQDNPSWRRPFPGHRIAGNLYYVGTEDLACFLFATPSGHILVNTGLTDSTPLLRESFRQLGFRLEDVKILLTMQAHFDHVAAMAEVQRVSGAAVFATEADAPVLEDGGKSDPFLTCKECRFAPVMVKRRLHDGEIVELGGTSLRVISTPGHTRGSVSYETTLVDGGQRRDVVLANMGTVVMPLVGNSKYPRIAEDFARSFAVQKKLSPDIWVAAHASQYRMAEKRKTGSFVDPDGYKKAIDRYEADFRTTLAKEQQAHQAAD